MEIYLSSETEGRADSLLLPIRNMVDSLLDDIRKNEYGSALTSVGVFAIIMKEVCMILVATANDNTTVR